MCFSVCPDCLIVGTSFCGIANVENKKYIMILVMAHSIDLHASFRTGMELCEVEVANKIHNCHSNENVDVFGIIYLKVNK